MKITKIAMLILGIAIALYILIPSLSWAEDGAGAYQANHSVFRSVPIPARFVCETGAH